MTDATRLARAQQIADRLAFGHALTYAEANWLLDQLALARQRVCPHCQLPPVLSERCTPEIRDVLDAQIARDGALYEQGFLAGQHVARQRQQALEQELAALKEGKA